MLPCLAGGLILTGNRVGFSCPHLHKVSLPESRRAPPCLLGLAVYRKWRGKELQRLGHYPGVTSLQRVPCLPPASPPNPYRSVVPEAVLGSSLSGMLDRGRESALSAQAPQKVDTRAENSPAMWVITPQQGHRLPLRVLLTCLPRSQAGSQWGPCSARRSSGRVIVGALLYLQVFEG